MRQFLFLAITIISFTGISQSRLSVIKTANTSTFSCNLTYERTLQTFDVYIHSSGATMYRAKMYIDADGSPRAYGPNNSGLDWTANAGYPGNWWALITDANGNPILQGASDPYPGMYVCATSLANSNYALTNPLRYVNSETVPYIAIPTNVLASGNIIRGDVAYVHNTVTGQSCFAIYADAGNTTSIGEASIKTASLVGVNPNVKTGGTSLGIIDYVVFPHSGFGQGYIPTIAQIDSMGNAQLAAVGGSLITTCLNAPNDNIAPTSTITTSNSWDTTTFVANFTDLDNSGGSGVEKSFYQVCDYNGTEWRANATRGFFNDDFNGPAIHADWTSKTGTWNITSGVLQQTDETNSNTNLYAALTQTTVSNRFLYNWTGTLSGSGTNRRAGFHFFCDAPDSTNRGNSYFVFFRLDDDKIQIYKVTNNSWGSGPTENVTYNFTANQAYDFKVSYDRTTGYIKVYVDNILSAEWQDASPINTGTHVSFRSANCNYKVDNFRAYRSRNAAANIFVGSASTNYIRYQNPNPATPSGKIRTIITDVSGNLSTVVTKTLNIDWTNPSVVSNLNDGVTSDIDTTTNSTQLQANWGSAIDVNSNISDYYYAIGTTPGASNIVSWTNLPSSLTTSITVTGLSLVQSQKYYVSLQSENYAGMRSTVLTTDGQVYYNNLATSVTESLDETLLNIFPNPNNGSFEINFPEINSKTTIKVLDVLGKVVYQAEMNDGKIMVNLNNQAAGVYYVVLVNDKSRIAKKIVVEK